MEKNSNIPVLILCGGNLVEFSGDLLPKACIKLDAVPAFFHIINHYSKYGFKKFTLCIGDGAEKILELLNIYRGLLSLPDNIEIKLLFTGGNTQTWSRITQGLNSYPDTVENFAVTYVDTISDIDLNEVRKVFERNFSAVTLSAVVLPTRFKTLGIDIFSDEVKGFSNTQIIDNNLISGGYYFLNRKKLETFLTGFERDCSFENEILPSLIDKQKVTYFKHEGYWQYLDSKRNVKEIEKYLRNKS